MDEASGNDEIRAGHDFSAGVRGKRFRSYRRGTGIVLPEPVVAEESRTSDSVATESGLPHTAAVRGA